ncbi:MAG: TetR/AcrR family transcriptional regulator [Clostridiales bacterium]|nr:TetR/AcrR family transcriptional regulator [Clostridiales bacterium]
MTTKERIIDSALTLFAQKGYGDVYVGEIADAVGIKAPSLYKHFKNKQEIFDALIETMSGRYADQAATIGLQGSDAEKDAAIYGSISEDALVQMGTGLFLYFLHDTYMARFRKVLTLEQFKNSELSKLYTKQFFEDPIEYQSQMFAMLIKGKKLKGSDPRLMALEFYSPIYMLLMVCDRDPSYEKEAMKILEKHIREFISSHTKRKGKA